MAHLASFRSGWESENLARFILSKFAFIANPSTISDDIGIDYFCTLFQRKLIENHEYLIPRNSFAIQIKSDINKLDISDKVRYLELLELPFYIGIADKKKLKLTIYSGEYIPLLFSAIGLPKNLEIVFMERDSVNLTNYYEQIGDKCIIKFPKIIELEANINRAELIQKTDLLVDITSQIHGNLSNKRNGEYIFNLIQPNLAGLMIFAGPGSYNVFRENFVYRLAEVFYNLKWFYSCNRENFNKDEYLLFKNLYHEMEITYKQLPDVIKFAYTELVKIVEGK